MRRRRACTGRRCRGGVRLLPTVGQRGLWQRPGIAVPGAAIRPFEGSEVRATGRLERRGHQCGSGQLRAPPAGGAGTRAPAAAQRGGQGLPRARGRAPGPLAALAPGDRQGQRRDRAGHRSGGAHPPRDHGPGLARGPQGPGQPPPGPPHGLQSREGEARAHPRGARGSGARRHQEAQRRPRGHRIREPACLAAHRGTRSPGRGGCQRSARPHGARAPRPVSRAPSPQRRAPRPSSRRPLTPPLESPPVGLPDPAAPGRPSHRRR